MKRLHINIVLFVIIFSFSIFAAGKAKKSIRIPVRVFFEGEPVGNLSKGDFRLYENNRLQVIKDFSIKRKKIESQNNSRCFVLIFKIIDYNEQARESLAYFFNNILGQKDRLMILFGNKTVFFNNIPGKEKTYSIVDKIIARQSELMAKSMETDIKKTGEFISYLRNDYERNVTNKIGFAENQGNIYQHYYMTYFRSYLRRFLNIILDYNKRYLVPDADKYYLFSKEIENIDKEKWIIHFYQVAKVPRLSKRNRAMIKRMITNLANSEVANPDDEYDFEKKINRLLGSIDQALKVTPAYPAEEISNLFYKIDATFSSVFLDTGVEFKENKVEKSRQQSISKGIKNNLLNITGKTGGSFIDLREPGAKLETLIKKEDVYYLLTYSPENTGRPGKIKVEVSNNNYQIQYDDNIKADYFNEYIKRKDREVKRVSISNVIYKQKKLSIEIANFFKKDSQKKRVGKIHVHIRVEDQNKKAIFNENKTLQVEKDIVTISIGLKVRKRENYDVMVKVTDLISGDTHIEYSRI